MTRVRSATTRWRPTCRSSTASTARRTRGARASTTVCAVRSSSCVATSSARRRKRISSKKEFRDAAYTYVNIFRKYPECGKLDEVLYNAALNFEAAQAHRSRHQGALGAHRQVPGEPARPRRRIYLTGAQLPGARALSARRPSTTRPSPPSSRAKTARAAPTADKEAGTCPNAHEALAGRGLLPPRSRRRREGARGREALREELRARSTRVRPRRSSTRWPRSTSVRTTGQKVAEHYQSYLKKYGRQALPNEEIRANVQIGVAIWKLEQEAGRREVLQGGHQALDERRARRDREARQLATPRRPPSGRPKAARPRRRRCGTSPNTSSRAFEQDRVPRAQGQGRHDEGQRVGAGLRS